MRRMRAVLFVLCSVWPRAARRRCARRPRSAGRIPPAVFADPDRRAKLEQAFPEIDRLVTAFASTSRVPGIAYGVLIDGQLAHVGTSGVTDVAAKTPVTPDTVFRIASMTKSFTALAIMKLRDEGKLSLEDPAERYVPELAGLAYPTADAPRITIRHLLSHAEGFPEDNPWGDRQLAATDDETGADDAAGHPVLDRSRHRVRVLQLRVRDPRPDRRARVGHAVQGLRRGEPAGAARHDVDHASTGIGCRRACWRRATGSRTGSGSRSRRCPTAPSAPWAACSPRRAISRSTSRSSCPRGRRATTRTPARPPGLGPRDAAGLAAGAGYGHP